MIENTQKNRRSKITTEIFSSQIRFSIFPFECMIIYNIQYKILNHIHTVTEHYFLITSIKHWQKVNTFHIK